VPDPHDVVGAVAPGAATWWGELPAMISLRLSVPAGRTSRWTPGTPLSARPAATSLQGTGAYGSVPVRVLRTGTPIAPREQGQEGS
jgi:hypothetical protein